MATDHIREKLIEAVKKRRLLYDPRDKNYKNRNMTKAAWTEIALEMGAEDGNYWGAKWKILKDSYTKHKKSSENSGALYKKYKKWPWAKLMSFTDEFNRNAPMNYRTAQEPVSTQENLNCITQEIQIISQDATPVYQTSENDIVLIQVLMATGNASTY